MAGISSDPRNTGEEYIKIEMIVHKKGVCQEDLLERIKNKVKCGKVSGYHIGMVSGSVSESHISVEVIAITGIELVDKSAELDEGMNAAITGAKSEIMQEWLGEGQDVMAKKFYEKHPMWPVVTNCPACGTPNTSFPCKRCG